MNFLNKSKIGFLTVIVFLAFIIYLSIPSVSITPKVSDEVSYREFLKELYAVSNIPKDLEFLKRDGIFRIDIKMAEQWYHPYSNLDHLEFSDAGFLVDVWGRPIYCHVVDDKFHFFSLGSNGMSTFYNMGY